LIVSLILDLRGRSRGAGQNLQPPAGRSQNQPRGHAAPVSRGVPPPENQILIKKNQICSNCGSMIDCYVKYGRKKIKDNFVFTDNFNSNFPLSLLTDITQFFR